jgi:hypothetical protein
MLGMQFGFDIRRLMRFSRVVNVGDKKVIGFHEKEVGVRVFA